MRSKLVVVCLVGGLLFSGKAAQADRGPMETAVVQAIAAGDYPQALANLERMRASIAIALDDGFVRARTDDAWGKLLDAKLVGTPRTGFGGLVALDSCVQQARLVRASKTEKRFVTELEALVATMLAETHGDPGAQLARLRSITVAAATNKAARARLTQAETKVTAQLERLVLPSPFGPHILALAKAAYLLTPVPQHPRPISAKYELRTTATCADVVNATKASLADTGSQAVTVELDITSCVPATIEYVQARDFEYQVKEQVAHTVREAFVEEVIQYETKCASGVTRCSSEVETLTGVGLRITRNSCTTIPGECGTVPVTSTRTAYRDVAKIVDEMVAHTERALVTTRTISVTISGTATLRVGTTQISTPLTLQGSASDEQYSASVAGQNHSFGDIEGAAMRDAGKRTSVELADNAQLAHSLQRAKELRAQLPNATSDTRLALLLELAVQERKGEAELVAKLSAATGIAANEFADVLQGKRYAASAVPPHLAFEFDLPAANQLGVAGLRNDEERTVINRTTIIVGGVYIGAATFAADARKYGAAIGVTIARTPGVLAYRRVTGYGFVDGNLQIAGGGVGDAAIGFAGKLGLAAGIGFEQGGVFAHLAGGVDGIYVNNSGTTPLQVPGSTRVPTALSWGYGAALRLSKLYVSATRMFRNSDVYPERWSAEARWGRPFYLGVAGYSYRTLLDQTGNRGPIEMMLVVGLELDPSTLNKGVLGTTDRLR